VAVTTRFPEEISSETASIMAVRPSERIEGAANAKAAKSVDKRQYLKAILSLKKMGGTFEIL
jgi:hypothetical protein